jgi:uncharacterized protein (TIGR03437 family)
VPVGTIKFTVTGSSGPLIRNATVELSVGGTPDFSLTVSPAAQSVVAGKSADYTVTIGSAGGFNSPVSLGCTGLPNGATCNFLPNSVTPNPAAPTTASLTVITAAATPSGVFNFAVTGSSGSLSHTASAGLTVNPVPDFSVSVTPASQSVSPGSAASYSVSIVAVGGFNSPVNLGCTGLPGGANCSFSPNPATQGSATLTVSTAGAMPGGNYSFAVSGTSGSLSHSSPLRLNVSAPVIPPGSVTNGASFTAGASPGSIITIFGTRLTSLTTGIVVADKLPLPTDLRGTSVTVNGVPAPLFAIANVNGVEQINLQIPHEVAGQSSLSIVVTNNGVSSDPIVIPLQPQHPGVFVADWATGAGAILHGGDYTLVSSSKPVARGEVVLIYATGLGPLRNAPPTGQPASASPLSETTITPVVTFSGITASEILFSGLAPSFVGLYQVNVRVPLNAPSGNVDVVIQTGGQTSKAVKMAVQ